MGRILEADNRYLHKEEKEGKSDTERERENKNRESKNIFGTT